MNACLCLLATLLAGAAPPPAPAAAPEAGLGQDPRLQAPVTRAVADRPLGELVPALGQELGVPLTVERAVAGDKATFFVKARPTRDVLLDLARHLDLEWVRARTGFELRQPPAVARREAAERQAVELRDWEELQTYARLVERLSRLGAPQLQARQAEVDAALKQTATGPERAPLALEAAALREAARPAAAAGAAVLLGLSPPQAQYVRAGNGLTLSGGPGGLSPRVLEQVQAAARDARGPWTDGTIFPVTGDAFVRSFTVGQLDRRPRPGDRRSTVSVMMIIRQERDGKPGWREAQWIPALPERERPTAAPTQTTDPVLLREVELKLPSPGAGRQPTDTALTWDSRLWPAWPRLSDVARALHEQVGLDVLADSFARSRVDPVLLKGPRRLVDLLDALDGELGYRWQKTGSRLEWRSRGVAWDRAEEVPARVLQPWQARVARNGYASLDDLGELATALTDSQALGMGHYWGWYLESPWIPPPNGGGYEVYEDRFSLRFWATLTAAQKKQALAGEVVPVAGMSRVQSQAFAAALLSPVRSPWNLMNLLFSTGRAPTPQEVQAGGFSVTTEEWRRQLFLGVDERGKEQRVVAIYPTYRPPNLHALPEEFQWSPLGAPCATDSYTFSYFLNGETAPARKVEVSTIRPKTG